MYSIAITYAVLHHELFNVHVVIRRSLVYSLLVTTLTVGYFGLVYVLERSFQIAFGYQSVGLSLTAFALMAVAFQPLKIGIQRIVDWVFFRAPHEEIVKRMEQLEQKARDAEKLKEISILATGMAHEIKNPLASIKVFAEYLPKRYDDPDFRAKFARIVGQELDKINSLVQRLLDYAKPAPPQRRPVELSPLIDGTLELLQERLVRQQVEVARHYDGRDDVSADPMQMRQVFLNLLINSLDAMDGPGRLTIQTTSTDGHLETVITDTGPGIEPKDLLHIFDPFYTTKPLGTGLGLAITHRIIKEHGGRITIDSERGLGTSVCLRLPLAERTQDPRRKTQEKTDGKEL